MRRAASWLQILPGEGRMTSLLFGLFFFTATGSALGSNAADALLYARFGVRNLPVLFIALGLVTVLTTLAVTAVLGRGARERFYVRLALGLAAALVAIRLAMLSGAPAVFPVMWLAMNVGNSLQGILTWGLAGASCDTRQAKRLFPLFASGGILGAIVGGLSTRPAAQAVHSENLLIAWALSLALASACGLALIRSGGPSTAPHKTSFIKEVQQGFQTVRHSTMLAWLSAAVTLFALLYASLQFPFARAATSAFPSADSLAGFLGVFQAATTGVAFLASLFIANRLFARIGLMNSVIVFCLLYLAAFAVLLAAGGFWVLVGVRFLNLAYLSGIAGTAYHALFNVVPGERRDQARTFLDGVPAQLGTAMGGGLLVIAQSQPASVIYAVGVAGSVVLVGSMLMARRAYGQALIEALRSGRPSVFVQEPGPFIGFDGDGSATRAAIDGLGSADAITRRVAAEVLSELRVPAASEALAGAIDDKDPAIRIAAVRGLAGGDRVESRLTDDEPTVRAAAAVSLLRSGPHPVAEQALRQLAAAQDPVTRIAALDGLRQVGIATASAQIEPALSDANAGVRMAGLRAVAELRLEGAESDLRVALLDTDPYVRDLAAHLIATGDFANGATVAAWLEQEALEDGALAIFEQGQASAANLQSYAETRRDSALRYDAMSRAARAKSGARFDLLADSLKARSRRLAVRALRAAALLGRKRLTIAVEALEGRDTAVRANALETLESLGQPGVVRPLLGIFEGKGAGTEPPAGWLEQLRSDPDPWLRECADLVAGVQKAEPVKTLATLPLMDRIVFLRGVPLFADLDPADLKQVAAIATEQLHPDQEEIVRQGDAGEEMYVIVSGQVRVEIDGTEVAVRKTGDHVGEMAILTREPRMATLVSAGEVRTLSIARPQFEAMLRERPDIGLAVIRSLCNRLSDLSTAMASRPKKG